MRHPKEGWTAGLEDSTSPESSPNDPAFLWIFCIVTVRNDDSGMWPLKAEKE